jgi:hypothetical protein
MAFGQLPFAIAFNDDIAKWVNDVWLPETIAAGWKF